MCFFIFALVNLEHIYSYLSLSHFGEQCTTDTIGFSTCNVLFSSLLPDMLCFSFSCMFVIHGNMTSMYFKLTNLFIYVILLVIMVLFLCLSNCRLAKHLGLFTAAKEILLFLAHSICYKPLYLTLLSPHYSDVSPFNLSHHQPHARWICYY